MYDGRCTMYANLIEGDTSTYRSVVHRTFFLYFLLLYVLAAGDEPEIKTHNTDFSRRTRLKEGL